MKRTLKQFVSDQYGNASIEFVIVFPLIMVMFLSMVEIGWLATRSVFLERGLDMAVRDVRLGQIPAGMTVQQQHDFLKQRVCDNTIVLSRCSDDLILELVQHDPASAYPQNQANCLDRTGAIAPVVSFNPGTPGAIMFVRACLVIDPIFPGIGVGLGLPKDNSGGYQMVSYSAFMNEPA